MDLTRQHFGMTVVKEEVGGRIRGCTTVDARYSCVIHDYTYRDVLFGFGMERHVVCSLRCTYGLPPIESVASSCACV